VKLLLSLLDRVLLSIVIDVVPSNIKVYLSLICLQAYQVLLHNKANKTSLVIQLLHEKRFAYNEVIQM